MELTARFIFAWSDEIEERFDI